jgi:hypothetical protein
MTCSDGTSTSIAVFVYTRGKFPGRRFRYRQTQRKGAKDTKSFQSLV